MAVAEGDDDVCIVKRSDSEYYGFTVSSFTLFDLVDADRSNFVIVDDMVGLPLGELSP